MSAYEDFIARVRELKTLESVAAVLEWDQETQMPEKGGRLRAEQLALLSAHGHEMLTDPEIGRLLDTLEAQTLDDVQAANVREMRRAYDRATKLPAKLVEEVARHRSQALQVWQKARAASDFAMFRAALEKMLDLTIECAEHYGYEGDLYDALLEGYEPGATVAQLDPLFAGLREDIVPLVRAIGESGVSPDLSFMEGRTFPEAAQREFALGVSRRMGFDFSAGRMDRSTHPFCSGFAPDDVRFTARYNEASPFACLYGVMHETGHALYEQGFPAEHDRTPVGSAISLGIHESQSRLWENMIGRSRAFWEYHLDAFKAAYPTLPADLDVETVYRAANTVRPSFIRVEADETTYNLHIMLRYELEKELVNRRLAVADLPAAWNAKMQEYLGVTPPDDAQGVLQDIHWAMGLMGYFPTYTLGNLYAGQLFAAVQREIPDLWAQVARGELAPLLAWMRERVHRYGSLYLPPDLIRHTLGEEPNSAAYVDYLKAKFGELYGL